MVNWKDIKTQANTSGIFDSYEFIDIKELVDCTFDVIDVMAFDNDKGPGAAAAIMIEGKPRKMVTHSIGVVKTLTSEEFMDAVGDEAVTVTLREGKSKKSGKYFYYVE